MYSIMWTFVRNFHALIWTRRDRPIPESKKVYENVFSLFYAIIIHHRLDPSVKSVLMKIFVQRYIFPFSDCTLLYAYSWTLLKLELYK